MHGRPLYTPSVLGTALFGRGASLAPLEATAVAIGPYRIYFVSHDLGEPPHVHVDRDDQSAKFWLAPVELARNLGFSAVELRRVRGLVFEHQARLLEAWNRFESIWRLAVPYSRRRRSR